MSRKQRLAVLPAMLMTVALHAGPPAGGDYVILRSTLDAGGGVSAGGDFVLTGTIGQPDAGTQPSIGSIYALAGGFWGQVVLNLIFRNGFE